jgi:hypothetical protein
VPSSSNSFRCSLRGHSADVFCRPLRCDAREVAARLAVLGHCHHHTITLPSSDQVLALPIGTRTLDVVAAASSSSRGARRPCCGPRASSGRPGGGRQLLDLSVDIDVMYSVFEWVPQIGGGGEVPSIEGKERGF